MSSHAPSEPLLNFGSADKPVFVPVRFVSLVQFAGDHWVVDFTADSQVGRKSLPPERGEALFGQLRGVHKPTAYDTRKPEFL